MFRSPFLNITFEQINQRVFNINFFVHNLTEKGGEIDPATAGIIMPLLPRDRAALGELFTQALIHHAAGGGAVRNFKMLSVPIAIHGSDFVIVDDEVLVFDLLLRLGHVHDLVGELARR
jgi:hypothetical protein